MATLFDHSRQRDQALRAVWRSQAPCRFEINHQLVLGRRLHGKIGGLLAFEDAIDKPDFDAYDLPNAFEI
jgi:hypothetical protein